MTLTGTNREGMAEIGLHAASGNPPGPLGARREVPRPSWGSRRQGDPNRDQPGRYGRDRAPCGKWEVPLNH